ncbi:hypothetical protein BJV82DRAFT_590536 [Fennellomyces sp. T-0311]|nr:hypothetical protein BJV82DRAFT_590536 [Fennellomyces sp. T-0311]
MSAAAAVSIGATQTAPSSTASKTECLVKPTRFQYKHSEFEYSIYAPSTRFLREMTTVFPHLTLRQRKNLLIVPIFQRCIHDLVGATPEINKERDDKLELFIEWGKRVVDRLASVGMWADITDPASGFPVCSHPGPTPYPDVQGTQALTHYDVQNVGCCHILLHPSWKSHIFPATFFTTAPSDILVKVINEVVSKQ